MELIYAYAILFGAILAGALVRAIQPFLQEKQAQEKTLESLRWIPQEALTEEQKQFIKVMSEPIHWLRYYSFTAIAGFVGVIAVALGGFVAMSSTLPDNLSNGFVLVYAATSFMAAMGGVDWANRTQKNANISKDAAKVSMLAGIADAGVKHSQSNPGTPAPSVSTKLTD